MKLRLSTAVLVLAFLEVAVAGCANMTYIRAKMAAADSRVDQVQCQLDETQARRYDQEQRLVVEELEPGSTDPGLGNELNLSERAFRRSQEAPTLENNRHRCPPGQYEGCFLELCVCLPELGGVVGEGGENIKREILALIPADRARVEKHTHGQRWTTRRQQASGRAYPRASGLHQGRLQQSMRPEADADEGVKVQRSEGLPTETDAREELARLVGSLREGNFYWREHQDMKQGRESTVKAEINESSEPYFLTGADKPTAQARVQTSAVMIAELQGSKEDFEIVPQSRPEQPLIHGRALWEWTVKPLTFGHGKKLRLLLRLQPKLSENDSMSYNLPSHEADIDVTVSPSYIFNAHKALIFGSSGASGLLGGLLKRRSVRQVLRRFVRRSKRRPGHRMPKAHPKTND